MMKVRKSTIKNIQKIYHLITKIISPITRLFKLTSDYTGPGAEFVKAIPALLILIAVTYPLWSLPIYMWLSIIYGPPLNFLLYSVWIGQIAIISALMAYIDYTRKEKS